MMYICAWQAPELQPAALISSRITLAAVSDRPAPPNSSGISAASQPCSVSASHELLRVPVRLERAPVLAGEALAQLARRRERISFRSSGTEKSTAASLRKRGWRSRPVGSRTATTPVEGAPFVMTG